jgi:hypothetical protein
MSKEEEDMKQVAAQKNRLMLKRKCTINENCTICLDSLLNKTVVFLPCKHYFHQTCFNTMIKNEIFKCALCRHNVEHILPDDSISSASISAASISAASMRGAMRGGAMRGGASMRGAMRGGATRGGATRGGTMRGASMRGGASISPARMRRTYGFLLRFSDPSDDDYFDDGIYDSELYSYRSISTGTNVGTSTGTSTGISTGTSTGTGTGTGTGTNVGTNVGTSISDISANASSLLFDIIDLYEGYNIYDEVNAEGVFSSEFVIVYNR